MCQKKGVTYYYNKQHLYHLILLLPPPLLLLLSLMRYAKNREISLLFHVCYTFTTINAYLILDLSPSIITPSNSTHYHIHARFYDLFQQKGKLPVITFPGNIGNEMSLVKALEILENKNFKSYL